MALTSHGIYMSIWQIALPCLDSDSVNYNLQFFIYLSIIYLCRWFFQALGRGICPLCYLSQWDERLKAWLLSHKLFPSSRLLATFWQFNIKRDHGVSVRGVWGLGRYFGFLMVLSIRLSWTTWSLYCRRDSRTNPGTKVYWSSF